MALVVSDKAYSSAVYKRFVLSYLTLIYAVNFLDRQIVSILVEPIKNELMFTDTQMGLLSGFAFALFYATLGIPIAALADKSNRKNIIAVCLAIFSLMTALCGTAGNFVQMLIYRMGVGIGEAGTSPPSHSIISDLYPPEKRSGAMAIFALGAPIGIFMGFAVGGFIAQEYGWRNAFYMVGLPGLVLAIFAYFLIPEPKRGMADGIDINEHDNVKATDVFKMMWHKKTAFHLIMGATVILFSGYSFATWAGAFLIRTYDVDLAFAGIALAFTIGVSGAVGAISSGILGNSLRKKDVRWPCWMICIAIAISIPCSLIGYNVGDIYVALGFLSIPAIVSSFYFGPMLAMLHGVVPLNARAMASAITLFIVNLIALGFGPTIVGLLSDTLSTVYKDQSLRYALMVLSVIPSIAIYNFYMASKHLKQDTI